MHNMRHIVVIILLIQDMFQDSWDFLKSSILQWHLFSLELWKVLETRLSDQKNALLKNQYMFFWD